MAGARRPTNRPNPRPGNSPGGLPNTGVPGTPNRPHMEFGQKGQDTGYGNRQTPTGQGRPIPGGFPNTPPPGFSPPNVDPGFDRGTPPPNRGSAPWMQKHPNGPLAQKQQGTGTAPPGFDYNAFNAWQDPNIGGDQPGPIQAGWGGFSSLSNSGGANSMMATKMNDYLNQQSVGGNREMMMNQLGYNNGGNAFDPSTIPHGTNQAYRQQAAGGGYDSPGIYQQQDAQGNYIGTTNVAQAGGPGQYTPLYSGRRRSTQIGGNIY